MSEILQDVEGAVCLIDDILVHGRSQEEHNRRLIAVLHRLQEAGLTLNEKKMRVFPSHCEVPGSDR